MPKITKRKIKKIERKVRKEIDKEAHDDAKRWTTMETSELDKDDYKSMPVRRRAKERRKIKKGRTDYWEVK